MLFTVFINFLIGIDQTLNTIVYIHGDGFGKPDETFSARAFRLFIQGVISDILYRTIDFIFFWQEAHCFSSWRAEIERKQLPNHYRGLV
jgi:hypothetical protein